MIWSLLFHTRVIMIRYLLFFNPFSGKQKIESFIPYITSEIQSSGNSLETYQLHTCEDDSVLVRNRLKETQTYDRIIIAGGDGTISYIMGMLIELVISVPVGLLPCGTCNDFSSVLSLGKTLKEQLQTILQGETIPVDLAAYTVNEKRKHFVCDYEFGGFSAVSYAVSPKSKKLIGKTAYYFEVIKRIWFIRTFPIKICADGRTMEADVFAVLILNGSRFAGITNLLPKANVSDGLMDIAVLHKCKLRHVPKMLYNIFSRRIENEPYIETFQCQEAEISSTKIVDTTVDGEKGDSLPLKIEMQKGCLNVLVPKK